METSLAEEVREKKMTLPPESFFFMSPYRSFTTAGCFSRFSHPAADGDNPDGEFQQKIAASFKAARAAGIAKPVMVGAIPFDTSEPSELFIPASWTAFSRTEKQHSARYASGQQPMDVVQRREIPEQDTFMAMVARAAALTATPEVDKVVLSRLIDITTRERVDSGALLERLIAQNPVPAITSTCRSRTAACCWAPARSCCCVKKARISALCRWYRFGPSPAGRCAGPRSGAQAAGIGKRPPRT